MKICEHSQYCGGCIYQGIPYENQIDIKKNEVAVIMKKSDIIPEIDLGFVPAPFQYRYRNKMEYTFGDRCKGGDTTLGMHQKGHFMNIVTVDECQLVPIEFNMILRGTLDYCLEKGYSKYNKKSHEGLLRHFIIRKGIRTDELLLNMVTSTQGEFDDDSYVSAMLNLSKNFSSSIVGILHTYNDNIADTVQCDRQDILYGRAYYNEKIMDLDYRVSAFSFFQTNVEAIERLYKEALSMLDDISGKVIFDLYCGTGTITQTLATKAKKAIGVEIVHDAISAAVENSKLNRLANCEFIEGDVLSVIDHIQSKPDVIVLDPPRVGIHPKALDKILGYQVDQILYISCNPKTMVLNMMQMKQAGYNISKFKAYDNFPGTKHIEAVALLTK
mgnify:CR=1 FL=1